MNRRILNHAETLSQLRADVCAELNLLGFGDVQFVVLLLAFLGLLGLADDAPELRVRRRADRRNSDDDDPEFHGWPSLTSKMATGRVFPFTTTSPRGRSAYRSGRASRVASLMIIRVPYSLFRDSRRAPRFTASPMTV